MKKLLTVIFILYSSACFSQIRDTTLCDSDSLSKDKAFEISISVMSPGASIYTSETKNYMTDYSYFNVFYLGLCFKNISANFLFNLKGMKLKRSYTFHNQFWDKGMQLTYYSFGFNLSYRFQVTSKLALKPFAGISSSNYYLVKHNANDPEQNSRTSFCGQYGINTEFRFKPKCLGSFVTENGDLKWGNSYWSILLQTGILPSIFKGNTGLKGNLLYITIGGSYNVGTYTHLRK